MSSHSTTKPAVPEGEVWRYLKFSQFVWLLQKKVHPQADTAFMETVKAVVEQYAPPLKDGVAWSDMNAAPPF